MQELQENEIIKDIKGYEGLYAITSFGRVWSYSSHTMKKMENGFILELITRDMFV